MQLEFPAGPIPDLGRDDLYNRYGIKPLDPAEREVEISPRDRRRESVILALSGIGERLAPKRQVSNLRFPIEDLANEIKTLALAVIAEFKQERPNILFLQWLISKSKLINYQFEVNSLIRDKQLTPRLEAFLYRRMRKLPVLLREAKLLQNEYYQRQLAAYNKIPDNQARPPECTDFLSGLEEKVEQNWISPFQFDLKLRPQRLRPLAERLAKPVLKVAHSVSNYVGRMASEVSTLSRQVDARGFTSPRELAQIAK